MAPSCLTCRSRLAKPGGCGESHHKRQIRGIGDARGTCSLTRALAHDNGAGHRSARAGSSKASTGAENLHGAANYLIGGWRISGVATYSSGIPNALGTSNTVPLFGGGLRPIISRYDNWQPATKGDHFDPAVDRT